MTILSAPAKCLIMTINFDILWQVLTVDLPALIAMLEKIVPPEDA